MTQEEIKARQKEIKHRMIDRELTAREVSRRLNVKYTTVTMCLALARRTPWLRRAIAQMLDSTVEELFGEAA